MEWTAMRQQLEQAKHQAIEAKKAVASGGAGGDEEGDARSALRKSKAEFAPRVADSVGGAAAKALRKTGSK